MSPFQARYNWWEILGPSHLPEKRIFVKASTLSHEKNKKGAEFLLPL
jgi:hypothetical protein